jgi:hypothetical protein
VKEVRVKDEKRERETKEREEVEISRKRDKDKEGGRRREKRQTSPPADTFEGDLSSVSNSSNGSMHPSSDLVIVEDPRGKRREINKLFDSKLIKKLFSSEPKRRKVEVASSKVSITV